MNRLEKLINEVLSEEKEKRDRCLRIADRKFDKPSAYKSGAVVRCRKGDIWKGINEYNNVGPSTPKTYIVKNDGTYKEVPIKILSKIPNLIYDMGGGETNYYPEKNIVIVDNIPIEQFVKEPGEIKDEKIYVEYNLNQPYSFPKANKIIAAQLVYNLDNVESFATTINNSLKDNGTFEFYSDVMIKKDKDFLNYLYSEYGFGFPKNLNQFKQEPIQLKKGKFVEPIISYIYNVTDAEGNTAKISVTKEGRWWEYAKIEGDIDFKPVKWSVEPEYKYNDITPSKENILNSFSKALKTDIVDFEKLNENLKEADDPQANTAIPYGSGFAKVKEEVIQEKVKETLRTWFSRKGAPGKKGGWVDCNSPIRKEGEITGYKACGRKEGEKRSKYPACRPTPAGCKDKGKGKTWGKTK
jgi:hypothetical protein